MVFYDRIDILQQLICRAVAFVYFIAFSSIYVQIPGLWGIDGILPVHNTMRQMQRQMNVDSNFMMAQILPSLLWFSDYINKYIIIVLPMLAEFNETDNVMHVMVLFAIVVSFLIMIGYPKFLLNPIAFAVLWI